MTVQQELRRLRRRVKKLEARNARISEALMVDAIRVLTKAEPITPPGRLPSLDDPIASAEVPGGPAVRFNAAMRGPWTSAPPTTEDLVWFSHLHDPTTVEPAEEVRFEASNKPETNEGEPFALKLVEPWTGVVTRDGIFTLKPGMRLVIPFDGPMRALWERQYRAQEDWKEHVSRNKVRAPRRPELSFLFESYPSLPFREDPELEARELFFLNPDRYFYGKIEPTE